MWIPRFTIGSRVVARGRDVQSGIAHHLLLRRVEPVRGALDVRVISWTLVWQQVLLWFVE